MIKLGALLCRDLKKHIIGFPHVIYDSLWYTMIYHMEEAPFLTSPANLVDSDVSGGRAAEEGKVDDRDLPALLEGLRGLADGGTEDGVNGILTNFFLFRLLQQQEATAVYSICCRGLLRHFQNA